MERPYLFTILYFVVSRFFCHSIIEAILLIQIYKLQIKVVRRATHFLFSLKPEKVFPALILCLYSSYPPEEAPPLCHFIVQIHLLS